MNGGIKLLDAERLQHRYPEAYPIPVRALRESLNPGRLVKLVFRGRHEVEALWVRIEEVTYPAGQLRYAGVLENASLMSTQLDFGTRIVFGAEHVVDFIETAIAPRAR